MQVFDTSFKDFLFLLLMLFLSLWLITIKEEQKKSENNTIQKAEFVITLEWDKESTNDIDLYLEDPLENLVFFKPMSVGLSNLERDDRGSITDLIQLPNGEYIEYKENLEKITIRGIIPGEYVIAIHMYEKHDDIGNIKIKLEKMNPYKIIFFDDKITQLDHHEGKFIKRFSIDEEGQVVSLSDLPKDIIPLISARPPGF